MDRMSPLDATFLYLEDDVTQLHIGSCAVFAGPVPPYLELVALIASKLPSIPRYRQRVRTVPASLGRPVWVDDPHFDLAYHVRHTALPAPGGDRELRALVGRLMSQRLDRHRPLWEAWVVEGLADGRWALVSKVHHCMVDGMAGTELLAVVLDTSPEATPLPEPPALPSWQPRQEPGDLDLVLDALTEAGTNPGEAWRALRASTRRPRALLCEVRDRAAGFRSLAERLVPGPTLSIEGRIGPHRRWSWAQGTLDDVQLVRKALGGTVNDVVLAAITHGFRDLLRHRGEPTLGVHLRTLVPVSVRAAGDHRSNNQISAMIAELPVGLDDPVDRLHELSAQLQRLKSSHQAEAASVVGGLAMFAPPTLLALGLRSAAGIVRRAPQRSVNTVTTNVPGPPFPLYARGRRLLEYFPYVPIAQGVRIGVAVISYDGRVSFGVTGDWDTTSDLDVLCTGIERGLAELVAAARAATAASTRGGGTPRRPRRPRPDVTLRSIT